MTKKITVRKTTSVQPTYRTPVPGGCLVMMPLILAPPLAAIAGVWWLIA